MHLENEILYYVYLVLREKPTNPKCSNYINSPSIGANSPKHHSNVQEVLVNFILLVTISNGPRLLDKQCISRLKLVYLKIGPSFWCQRVE